jgi:hypothetical protein
MIDNFANKSILYKNFLEEKKQILKIKKIESQKKGEKISSNEAFCIWLTKYKSKWKKTQNKN